MKSKNEVVAAFDFDGTITYHDSLVPFLFFTTDFLKTFLKLILLTPSFLAFLLRLQSRQKVKEKILHSFFNHITIQKLRQYGELFARERIPDLIKPEALKRLKWHQQQGHRCVLVSASINAYLEPWGRLAGFDHVLCSQLQVLPNGTVDGRLSGLNCWGKEKTRRLVELLGSKDHYCLYAYGDSRGDRELLAMADYPFVKIIPTSDA